MSYSIGFPWKYGSMDEASIKAVLPPGFGVKAGWGGKKFEIFTVSGGKKVGRIEDFDGQIAIRYRVDSYEALKFANAFQMLFVLLNPYRKVWAYVYTSPETGLREIDAIPPFTSLREAKKRVGHYTGTNAYLVHFRWGDYYILGKRIIKAIYVRKVNRNGSLGKEEQHGMDVSLREV
jgi:hypothetical protein